MLANMYVDGSASFLCSPIGSLAKHLPCQPGAIMPCGVFERIETLYLHLSRIITAERSSRAFTCMHVASRIAGSPNPINRISTIAIVTLEHRPILDGTGSALCCKIVSDRSVCNHVKANSGERHMGVAILGVARNHNQVDKLITCRSIAPAKLSGTVSQLDRTHLHVQGG